MIMASVGAEATAQRFQVRLGKVRVNAKIEAAIVNEISAREGVFAGSELAEERLSLNVSRDHRANLHARARELFHVFGSELPVPPKERECERGQHSNVRMIQRNEIRVALHERLEQEVHALTGRNVLRQILELRQ